LPGMSPGSASVSPLRRGCSRGVLLPPGLSSGAGDLRPCAKASDVDTPSPAPDRWSTSRRRLSGVLEDGGTGVFHSRNVSRGFTDQSKPKLRIGVWRGKVPKRSIPARTQLGVRRAHE
jgi:hypothetical protein